MKSRFSLLLALIGVPGLFAASGTIYYNAEGGPDGRTVRAVGADGSNDRLIPISLPAPSQPIVSPDGRHLLVTSGGEWSTVMRTRNVYNVNLLNGTVTPITHYRDTITVGTTIYTNLINEPEFETTSYYTTHLPLYKAFSPAGDKVAVLDHSAVSGKPPGGVRLAAIQTPILEVYPVQQTVPLGDWLFAGAERTTVNQAGDGVDWHPTRNELISTFRSNIPTTGTLGPGESEGTVVMVFASSGLNPFIKRLTTPTGRTFIDFTTFVSITEIEQDYAPAISRDGSKVAYLRNTLVADSRVGLGIHLLKCSIRLVNYDGTGDQEIASFGNQLWITKLAWSPDDAELAFDIAPRLVIDGLELQMGDPAQSEIHIINLNNQEMRLLAPAPAAFPTWSTLESLAQPQAPRLNFSAQNPLELEVSNVLPGQELDLETSTNLDAWTPVETVTVSGEVQKITLAKTPAKTQFWRVRLR